MKIVRGVCTGLVFASLFLLVASLARVNSSLSTDNSARAQEKAKPAGQNLTPVEQLQIYVDGFHNYKREADLPTEKQKQMRVTHYCQAVNSDFIQCVVFDGNTKAAHLIGVEHIISEKSYQSLPAPEKKYWHPHDGEVDSGMLDLPGIPDDQKKGMLEMIRTTHGKTWHVWDSHKEKIPTGTPSLMWAVDPKRMNAETKSGMEQRKKNIQF